MRSYRDRSPYHHVIMDARSHFPAIVTFYHTHRRMTTYRDIMRLAGFRSTNAAAKLVKKLVASRLIRARKINCVTGYHDGFIA